MKKMLALVLVAVFTAACIPPSWVLKDPPVAAPAPSAPGEVQGPPAPEVVDPSSIRSIIEDTLSKMPQQPPSPGMDVIDMLAIGLAAAGFGWLAKLLPLIRPLIWSIIFAFRKKQEPPKPE